MRDRPWLRLVTLAVRPRAVAVVVVGLAVPILLSSGVAAAAGSAAARAGAASFCASIPSSRVAAIVGHPVIGIAEATGHSSGCIFHVGGAAAAGATVSIGRSTFAPRQISKLESSSIALWERTFAKYHFHCTFSPISSLGKDAFSFHCAYAIAIIHVTFEGVDVLRGTVDYSVVAISTPSRSDSYVLSLAQEEALLRLALAA